MARTLAPFGIRLNHPPSAFIRFFGRAIGFANDRDNQTIEFQQLFGDPADVLQAHRFDFGVAGVDIVYPQFLDLYPQQLAGDFRTGVEAQGI